MKRKFRWPGACALCAVLALMLTSMPLVAFAAYENTYVNTGNQAFDLVGVAKTQIGYVESGSNGNKYSSSFGYDNQPWCGYFISWCARQAGIPTAIIPTSGLASAFKNCGVFHARTSGYIPQPGDLVHYSYGHIGIVERYDSATGKFWIIDGNWSDKVSNHAATLNDSGITGFATPLYTSSITELSAFNLAKPTYVLKGKGFSISGLVCSPKKLTKVTVSVADADGNTKLTASATPNEKQYDVAGLDSKIKFGTLVAGEYSYIVAATDESGASKRWANTFEVVSEITMTIENVKAPELLETGKTFSISGKITCLETLTTVSVSVYDSNNEYKTGGTANPNTTTYDIRGVDSYVSFGKLTAGSYTMRVAARSANAYKTWEYPFVVSGGIEFTTSDMVTPSTIIVGEDIALSGTITCSQTMAAVSAKILATDGTVLQSAVANPNTLTYGINTFNRDLDFGALALGNYTLRIAARSSTVTEEWLIDFTVKEPFYTLTDEVVPEKLKVGEGFTVAGIVKSEEAMDALTLNILDAEGERLSTVTVNPAAKSYDIGKLSDDVPFSTLAAGGYTFRIGVRAGSERGEWLFPFTVATNPDSTTLGDLNFDGEVDTFDTMLLYRHVSGGQPLTDAQKANVGFDELDITVAMKLFAYTSGSRATYP